MPDRETLIRAIRCIVNLESGTKEECRRRGCPYAKTDDCMIAVLEDALERMEEAVQSKRQFIGVTSYSSGEKFCINKDIISMITNSSQLIEYLAPGGAAIYLKGANGGYEAGTVAYVRETVEDVLKQLGVEP